MGMDKRISPPPPGATPRLSIFRSRPSVGTPKRFNMGKVAERNVSTDGSLESFVIPVMLRSQLSEDQCFTERTYNTTQKEEERSVPLSLIDRGFLANKASTTSGSKKYPMDRLRPQS